MYEIIFCASVVVMLAIFSLVSYPNFFSICFTLLNLRLLHSST
jgi:hypothetical protein